MPGKAFRSKLTPHAETIAAMRRGGGTWKEIAEHLTAAGCPTDLTGVHHFFRRWSRRPYALGMEPEPDGGVPGAQNSAQPTAGERNGNQMKRETKKFAEEEPFMDISPPPRKRSVWSTVKPE